jgi:large subunit ribosomal protein L6
MSRVAKAPVTLPKGVEVTINGQDVQVKGAKGALSTTLHVLVELKNEEGVLKLSPRETTQDGWMQTGTARALVNNLVIGVSAGFERKLQLVGVGYKAQAKGKVLNLALGFSHPIDYELPEGVTAETPTPTEIILKSSNKQLLGQVAADVRGYPSARAVQGQGCSLRG